MIVADTNVIAYSMLPSPFTALAEQLMRKDPNWIAPILWRSEMRNLLSLYMRKSLLTLSEVQAIQAEAEDLLEGSEFQVDSAAVLALAAQSGCAAYDCEFVALARQLGVKLITMDAKLVRGFPDTVMSLGDAVAVP